MCIIGSYVNSRYSYEKPTYAWKVFDRGYTGGVLKATWVVGCRYFEADLKPGVRHTALQDGYNKYSDKTTRLNENDFVCAPWCGFFSFKSRDIAARHYNMGTHVCKRVKLTGKILEYERGYRSDHFEVIRERS